MNPPIKPRMVKSDKPRSQGKADRTSTKAERISAGSATLERLEETLQVSKRAVLAGTVRVSTQTETFEEIAEIALDRGVVDVTRVAIGQIVEVTPSVRTEGDTTIVPVVEERFVVVKQLFLKEELHIRHRVETDMIREPVTLRRQTATVQRLDAWGNVVAAEPDMETQLHPNSDRHKGNDHGHS